MLGEDARPDTPQQYEHQPPVLRARLARVWNAVTRKKTVEMIRAEMAAEEAAADGGDGSVNGGSDDPAKLPRVLSVFDLVAYGVGATVGVGVFVITGVAASETAGPALVLSFLVSAIACLFSGFCYCEFATRIPVAGSAYTYAYASLGELIGFIIGWNLTLEYGISASAVARGWSGYLGAAFEDMGAPIPKWLTSLDIGFAHVSILSVVIVVACTVLLCVGVKSSAQVNLVITVVNICIILFVCIAGSFYVDRSNWSPFMAYGVSGMFRGAAKVFFSYIGFDTVSGLAEEVKNPQRDLPIGIAGTLGVAAVLYMAVSLVITGMVFYPDLDKDAPLSKAFSFHGVHWAADLVAIGSVTTLTATTLCSLLGQPRIFMRMAKDGLFFKQFSTIHPKYRTPVFGTIVTGILSGTLAFFFDIDTLADMISIGTLLAFNMVCAAVLVARYNSYENQNQGTQATAALVINAMITMLLKKVGVMWPVVVGIGCVLCLPPIIFMKLRLRESLPGKGFVTPLVPFFPAAGVLINTYLLFELDVSALYRLVVWTAIGLSIYIFYGFSNSKLNTARPVKQKYGRRDGREEQERLLDAQHHDDDELRA